MASAALVSSLVGRTKAVCFCQQPVRLLLLTPPLPLSSTLSRPQHLLKDGQDVVKRWVNEVQQAVNAHTGMTQYHALGVLYHIKAKDRLAVQKLVSTHVAGHTLRSSYAYCLLIRYASKVGDGCPSLPLLDRLSR